MAHSLSAKKRIRQNLKRRAQNRARKDRIRESVKGFLASVTAGQFDQAKDQFKEVSRRLLRTADKGTIHKNAASRKRSRLAKKLNAAMAGKGTVGRKTSA